ncbi:choice-of-anchor G family protein [Jatrophihabitans sp.]|uniref:choice-of-anchor G family protein n=1 Tax=Jatrophihabitans sp. TaxID=1932789 RepID=UPI0030C702B4
MAGTVVAAVAVTSFAFNGTGAGAATTPNSQSVGRFVDGSVGGSPLESLLDIKDARAVNPGSVSDQNPLDVKLFNALDIPLTHALQLPKLAGINLGAANQVAVAKSDGYSYGASGAVANSGGVSVGGNNSAYPADASIDLTPTGIAGNAASGLDALGGVTVKLGAVSALASTPVGVDKGSSTNYQIAGLKIVAGSPLLGSLLKPLTSALGGLLGSLGGAAGLPGLPSSCLLSSVPDTSTLTLDKGAIVIDVANASLTIDLEKLLAGLKLNLNKLKPNTDLIQLLVKYIADPNGLAKGIEDTINDLLGPLETQFTDCTTALGPLGGLLSTLLTTLTGLQATLESTVTTLLSTLTSAVGADPLKPLADILTQLVDIGVNVQPNGPKGDYTDALKATPAQDTSVVAGQTVVRAIEVNVLGKKTLNLALANAAAGPSNPQAAPPTSTTTITAPPSTAIPTGVPAGLGTKGGSPATPLILLLVGLLAAGGGVTAHRLRGRRSH